MNASKKTNQTKIVQKINKKGFTYVTVSIFLVIIIFTIIFAKENYQYSDKQELYSRRLLLMNDFVKGFNQDLERATQIAAFRTLIALEDDVATKGRFLADTETSFKETIYNGTIEGVESVLMENSSLSDYIKKVETIANRSGLNATINIKEIRLSQIEPWSINVETDIEVYIYDFTNLAEWKYNQTIKSNVPINNLRDPLYSVFTLNRQPNMIRKSNYTPFVTPQNDTTNLTYHIDNGYYIASNKAPSFLMRFENNNSASEYGIESIVSIDALMRQDLEEKVYLNRIKIDYIYFNNTQGLPKICNIQDVNTDYALVLTDDERVNQYDIDGLQYDTSCPN